MNKVVQLANTTNGAKDAIDLSQPYSVALSITGSADFLARAPACSLFEEPTP